MSWGRKWNLLRAKLRCWSQNRDVSKKGYKARFCHRFHLLHLRGLPKHKRVFAPTLKRELERKCVQQTWDDMIVFRGAFKVCTLVSLLLWTVNYTKREDKIEEQFSFCVCECTRQRKKELETKKNTDKLLFYKLSFCTTHTHTEARNKLAFSPVQEKAKSWPSHPPDTPLSNSRWSREGAGQEGFASNLRISGFGRVDLWVPSPKFTPLLLGRTASLARG